MVNSNNKVVMVVEVGVVVHVVAVFVVVVAASAAAVLLLYNQSCACKVNFTAKLLTKKYVLHWFCGDQSEIGIEMTSYIFENALIIIYG